MKITPKITKLLFDISELEDSENTIFLRGELTDLPSNLVDLYHVTNNQSSRDKIIAIMGEAGYPWFEKLATASQNAFTSVVVNETPELDSSRPNIHEDQFLSEEDFLDLLPANSHFH